MIKDVKITVKGIQGVDGNSDTVELVTDGRFGIKDGKYFISYDEGQLIEGGFVKTKLLINSPSSVVLNRCGAINSRMEIKKKEKTICLYSTPIGNISMEIYGEDLKIDLNEMGGRLKLEYSLYSNSKPISRNKVEITVKEV